VRSAVLLLVHAQSRVGDAPEDVARAVGRAVVHDDDLEGRDVLGERGRDGLADETRVIERWNHDGDERPVIA